VNSEMHLCLLLYCVSQWMHCYYFYRVQASDADTEKIESYPGMMQSIVEHEVTTKEDAVVKPVKGRKKRHRGRKPAAGRHGGPD
jgi:hypothetical protein